MHYIDDKFISILQSKMHLIIIIYNVKCGENVNSQDIQSRWHRSISKLKTLMHYK